MPGSINGTEHVISRENSSYLPRMSPEHPGCDRGAGTGPFLLSCPHPVLVMEETRSHLPPPSSPVHRVCLFPGSCWCPTIAMLNPCIPIPPPDLLSPTAPAWQEIQLWPSCAHSCRRALLPAGWLRAGTGTGTGTGRAAAPASSAQPGAAARALCFPQRPFISTAGERLLAMPRRAKGKMVLFQLRRM